MENKNVGFFYGLNKSMEKIAKCLLNSNNLCKLLYYDDDNPLDNLDLTVQQKTELLDKKFSIVPIVDFSDEKGSFLIIAFDSFNLNDFNPKFIDQSFSINVYSHKDLWKVKNGKLRPFLILNEIHQILEDSNMFGIGRVKLLGGSLEILSANMMGYSLKYRNIDFDRPINER